MSELRQRKNHRKKSAFREEEEYRTTRIPQWKAKDLHVIILRKVDPADAVSSTASGIQRVLQFSQNCSISAQQQQQSNSKLSVLIENKSKQTLQPSANETIPSLYRSPEKKVTRKLRPKVPPASIGNRTTAYFSKQPRIRPINAPAERPTGSSAPDSGKQPNCHHSGIFRRLRASPAQQQ